jgi:hypothetical protein
VFDARGIRASAGAKAWREFITWIWYFIESIWFCCFVFRFNRGFRVTRMLIAGC